MVRFSNDDKDWKIPRTISRSLTTCDSQVYYYLAGLYDWRIDELISDFVDDDGANLFFDNGRIKTKYLLRKYPKIF